MKNTLILEKRRTKIEIGKNYSLKRKIINLSFNPLWKQHQELDMLKDIKLDYNDLWIEQQGQLIELYIGDKTQPYGPREGKSPVMSNIKHEHRWMKKAAKQCPRNARVLTSGLGLGIILLYFAHSKKTKEVIIIEKEQRLVNALKNKLTNWFASKYPEFKFKIITGDINDEIKKHGTFDYIYLDIIDFPIQQDLHMLCKKQLNKNGKYIFQEDMQIKNIEKWVKLLDERDRLRLTD